MKKVSTVLILLTILAAGCKKEPVSSSVNTSPDLTANAPLARTATTTTTILQWQKSYGSSATDMGFAVAKATDGPGYVFAGQSSGNDGNISGGHGSSDAWIFKTDIAGAIQWSNVIGGSGSDWAYDIKSTADGGYIVSGATSSIDGDLTGFTNHGNTDAWIIKLSSTGFVEWQKVLGGSGTERAMSALQTTDGGFLISGYTNSVDGDITSNHGDYDAWILKLSTAGELVWQKTYGGTLYDAAGTVKATANGFIFCAASASADGDLAGLTNHGGRDSWLFEMNASGTILWNKLYGGSGSEGDGEVFSTSDGGYVFSTTTSSNNGDVSGNHGYVDTWLVKTDAAGNKQWQKCYGGTDMDNAGIVDVNAAGQIILAGYTFSRSGDITNYKGSEDMWVLQVAADGTKILSTVLGGKSGDMANSAIPLGNGEYLSAGRSNSTTGDVTGNHGGDDVWVVRFKL